MSGRPDAAPQTEARCYALEQLRIAQSEIPQLTQAMVMSRAHVEQHRDTDLAAARDDYSELQNTRKKLAETLGNAQLLLMEAEEYQLATTAGKLREGLLGFNLMSNVYRPVYDALNNFAAQLPLDGTTNAKIVGRMMNNIKMGYYPTDPDNIVLILKGIRFPDGVTTNLLDPCCGCGKALRQIAQGNNCFTYGVELDEARADEAQTRLHRVGFGSFFYSQVSMNSFHLLFLNPPYLSVLNESGTKARHEKRFLIESLGCLAPGGLLVYVIPYYRLTPDICRVLVDNFANLGLWRFTDGEFKKFKQIAVMGIRKTRDVEPQDTQWLEWFAAHPGSIPSLPIRIDSALFLAAISPVATDTGVSGAIISIAGRDQLELYAAEQQNELRRQGFDAPFTFENFVVRSVQSQAMIKQARRYAQFDLPLLINGELGTEKEELAQCIHNCGPYSDRAFIHFNCDGPDPERTTQRLFAPGGFLDKAQGTVFLNEVSKLSAEGQYLLYRTITGRAESSYCSLEYGPSRSFRMILADSRDLYELTQSGKLREDLYYAISVMTLQIPPLRQRREDIRGWAELFFQTLQQRHRRYMHLTQGAWEKLCSYDWPGNLAQLRSVCERILVDAPRRNVNEQFLETVFYHVAPVHRSDNHLDGNITYQDPKAEQISKLLKTYLGSRSAVAKEMGISKTTLWRYMKKYGIQG